MLAPWKESYDKLRQLIESKDITLPTKVHIVKPMVFPVVMYGCESWTIKKAECWRIDVFELVLSHFSHVWLFATPWIPARQAPLSMGFSRQEYWSGLPFPSPGDLPNPGIEPTSFMSPELAGRFFTTKATWEAPVFSHWPSDILFLNILIGG